MTMGRQTIMERIEAGQVEIREAHCEASGYEIGRLVDADTVIHEHHPAGISKEDFYLFCHPDDASGKKVLTNVRSNLSAFALGNSGFADTVFDGVRPFITREAIDGCIKDMEENLQVGVKSQHAAILRFILDHSEPATIHTGY